MTENVWGEKKLETRGPPSKIKTLGSNKRGRREGLDFSRRIIKK